MWFRESDDNRVLIIEIVVRIDLCDLEKVVRIDMCDFRESGRNRHV